jgi:hypothetical protein
MYAIYTHDADPSVAYQDNISLVPRCTFADAMTYLWLVAASFSNQHRLPLVDEGHNFAKYSDGVRTVEFTLVKVKPAHN